MGSLPKQSGVHVPNIFRDHRLKLHLIQNIPLEVHAVGNLHQGKPLLLQTKYRPFCDVENFLPLAHSLPS